MNGTIVSERQACPQILYFLPLVLFELCLHQFYLQRHYSCDCYPQLYEQFVAVIENHSDAGRPLSALFVWVLDSFRINVVQNQVAFTVTALLLLAAAIQVLTNTALALKGSGSLPDRLLFTLAFIIVVNNMFAVEMMMFSGFTAFHALSMLLIAISIKVLVERSSWIAYGALVCAVTLFYQGYVGMFVALTLVFLMYKNSDSLKRFIFSAGLVGGIAGCALLLSRGYQKVIHPIIFPWYRSRSAHALSFDVLSRNLASARSTQELVWIKTFYLLPEYLFVISLLLSAVLFVVAARRRPGTSLSSSAMALCSLVSAVVLSFALLILTPTYYISPRMIPGIAALPGLLYVMALLYLRETGGRSTLSLLIAAAVGISVAGTVVYTARIEADTILTNRRDREYALDVIKEIVRQERETGKPSTRLAFVADNGSAPCYDQSICFGNLNSSARLVSWSLPSLLRMYSGRQFEYAVMDQSIFEQHFRGRDWDRFSSEQVVVRDGTVYLAIY